MLIRISFVRPDDESGEVTEMRLIDAEKLVDMLYDNEFAVLCPLDEVSGVVDACPTVDAVEVVRCRDCRSYNKPKTGWCEVHLDCEHPDDYCSYGKRKDGRDG